MSRIDVVRGTRPDRHVCELCSNRIVRRGATESQDVEKCSVFGIIKSQVTSCSALEQDEDSVGRTFSTAWNFYTHGNLQTFLPPNTYGKELEKFVQSREAAMNSSKKGGTK